MNQENLPPQVPYCRGLHPSGRNAIQHGAVCAVLACLAFASSPVAAQESITVVDWKDAAPGPVLDTNFGKAVTMFSHSRGVIVGAETDPPSPLPNEQALFVTDLETSETKPRFRLEALPFSPEAAPAEGWVEFPLSVAEGGFRLQLGAGGSAGMSLSKDSPYDGRIVMLFLIQATGPGIYSTDPQNNQANAPLGMNVPERTPFTLRVLWNVTPETLTFHFQLDGTDVHDSKGGPLSVIVPNTGAVPGIDYIALTGIELYIGKITAGRGTGPM